MTVQVSDSANLVTRSLWLPVGRANFYSYTANGWLVRREGDAPGDGPNAWSDLIKKYEYVPRLQVSVLRRVLEVLPRSFGYEPQGTCTFTDEDAADEDGQSFPAARPASAHPMRPIKVAMTLRPLKEPLVVEDSPQWRANHRLVELRVPEVTFSVDENGFYTVRAPAGDDPEAVGRALEIHLAELFGGRFRIQWQLDIEPDEYVSPSAAERAGLARKTADDAARYEAPARVYNDQETEGHLCRPLGILTFFQLNTLFEGLFNDALSPAIFFEQTSKIQKYLAAGPDGTTATDPRDRDDPVPSGDLAAPVGPTTRGPNARQNRLLWFVEDVIGLITTTLDADKAEDRLVILRHFLAVTSRESLHKIKWSVESVRRALLDEMMGILHRQSSLIQVKLDKLGRQEWSPELAQGANESQLHGYVMLAGAKLPLIANVHRFAAAAAQVLLTPELRDRPAGRDLAYRVDEWQALLDALKDNVAGLEKSVEHAWMERLLYEQEQSRAEQEAMAEIERTRASRLGGSGGATPSPLGGTYNTILLYFTIVAAVAAVTALRGFSWDRSLDEILTAAWPVVALAAVLALFPAVDRLGRRWKARLLGHDMFGYEFAFRLDQIVDTEIINKHLSRNPDDIKELEAEDRKAAADCPRLTDLRIDRQGGARVEYSSADSTLVKLHLSASFRTRRRRHRLNPYGWFRRPARFEIINEFLIRRASGDETTFFLRETRMFGDAPRALDPDEIMGLLRFVLLRAALVFQPEDSRRPLTADDVLRHAGVIFKAGAEAASRPAPSPRQSAENQSSAKVAAPIGAGS
jgi:hypothetical protein